MNYKNFQLQELTIEESIEVYGGAPSADTGFWYDVAYYVTKGVLGVLDSMATSAQTQRSGGNYM